MAQGNITLTANTSGGDIGSRQLGPGGTTRMQNTAVSAETIVSLTVGTNTISIPAGATFACIIPTTNTGSTTNISYPGVLTFGSNVISSNYFFAWNWDAAAPGGTSFVLTATTVGTITVWFS